MTTTDYLIDVTLILLVLLQVKERQLTMRTLVRPLVILGIAVANYLHGIPTGGNDLALLAALAILGGSIGVASGLAVIMRTDADGRVLIRSGWISGLFWVLGMGSRFAFAVWMSHGGMSTVASFSAHNAITSAEAWTVALLGMAVFEIVGRTVVQWARWRRIEGAGLLQFA
jgi:hypothetical protein